MTNAVSNAIFQVCELLNQHEVEYLVVGGTAVAFHGYFRWSIDQYGNEAEVFDLDIWYNPTYSNYYKLLDVLDGLGIDVRDFKDEVAPNPSSSFFQFEIENLTIDFLPHIKIEKSFSASFDEREVSSVNGAAIYLLGIEDLIRDKESLQRPKDLEDIEHLKNKRFSEGHTE